MKLDIAYDFLPKRRSLNASQVMDSFGVAPDQGRHVVAAGVELEPRPGELLFFAGPSGSGKSSLLRAVGGRLEADGAAVLWLDRLELPDLPLAEALPLPAKEALGLLAACGLGEAQLLLRAPSELSEGQRYRFRLALGFARVAQQERREGRWLAADEFTATLDRVLAKALSYNLQRLARRLGVGLLLAATHDDVLADLAPDQLIRCDLDGSVQVEAGAGAAGGGRQPVSFFPPAGSAWAPKPTGRISLGGITAAIASRSSAGSSSCGMKSGPSASASSRRRPRRSGSAISTSGCGRSAARSG